VDDIRFSHGKISDHFKNNSPITDLVSQLVHGTVDPQRKGELILNVVEFEGKMWTLRNRRFCAFKAQQHFIRKRNPSANVEVQVYVLPLNCGAVLFKFLDAFSTKNGGTMVDIRRSTRSTKSRAIDPFLWEVE